MNRSCQSAIFTVSIAILSISIVHAADDNPIQDQIKRLKEDQIQLTDQIKKKQDDLNEAIKQQRYIDMEFDKLVLKEKACKDQFSTQSEILNVSKLRIITLTTRLIKIENDIDAISKREDPIIQSLQKIIVLDEAERDRAKQLVQKGLAGEHSLLPLERKVIESTLALQKYRSSLTEEHRRRMHLVSDAIEDADLESKIQEIHYNRIKTEYELAKKEIRNAESIHERPAELEKEKKELEKKYNEFSEKLKNLQAKP